MKSGLRSFSFFAVAVRDTRIELVSTAWEAVVLPLNQSRTPAAIQNRATKLRPQNGFLNFYTNPELTDVTISCFAAKCKTFFALTTLSERGHTSGGTPQPTGEDLSDFLAGKSRARKKYGHRASSIPPRQSPVQPFHCSRFLIRKGGIWLYYDDKPLAMLRKFIFFSKHFLHSSITLKLGNISPQ
ncbi:MAG: hypothetical protein G01um10148_418 [Parcubacteria group bacterium Gr01-1014_8]|nr:MAG: hypothetical protein G01um10148_418 [Parcubacteria group bacterium Gr01-1014_8]